MPNHYSFDPDNRRPQRLPAWDPSTSTLCQHPSFPGFDDDFLLRKPLFQNRVDLPVLGIDRRSAVLLRVLQMLANMLQAFIPRSFTFERRLTEETATLLRSRSHFAEALTGLCHQGLLFGVALRLSRPVDGFYRSCCFGFADGVHSSNVLNEEIFTVEVVRLVFAFVALITTPEAEPHVLSVDVTFPFVLRAECGCTTILSKRAWEQSLWIAVL